MVDTHTKAFRFSGTLDQLHSAVLKTCAESKIVVKTDELGSHGFEVTAKERVNWLSTNWPVKLSCKAERVGETWVVAVNTSSFLGSITQSANNSAKVDNFLSLLSAYAPSD